VRRLLVTAGVVGTSPILVTLIEEALSSSETSVPTSMDRGLLRGQRGGSRTVVNLSFLDRSRYFSFK
jgi:hypothetical protein